jgi:hypothetical protein
MDIIHKVSMSIFPERIASCLNLLLGKGCDARGCARYIADRGSGFQDQYSQARFAKLLRCSSPGYARSNNNGIEGCLLHGLLFYSLVP